MFYIYKMYSILSSYGHDNYTFLLLLDLLNHNTLNNIIYIYIIYAKASDTQAI